MFPKTIDAIKKQKSNEAPKGMATEQNCESVLEIFGNRMFQNKN